MKTQKRILYAAVLFVVAIGGVLAGDFLRRSRAGHQGPLVQEPRSLLHVGETFPDVPLTLPEGSRTGTRELLQGGGVVLFLDLECPPCADMARKWQDHLDATGAAPRVLGVTNQNAPAIAWFREEHAIHFPVAQDADQVFRHTYGVDRFPLEVVVGAEGRVRSLSYDSARPVDEHALAGLAPSPAG